MIPPSDLASIAARGGRALALQAAPRQAPSPGAAPVPRAAATDAALRAALTAAPPPQPTETPPRGADAAPTRTLLDVLRAAFGAGPAPASARQVATPAERTEPRAAEPAPGPPQSPAQAGADVTPRAGPFGAAEVPLPRPAAAAETDRRPDQPRAELVPPRDGLRPRRRDRIRLGPEVIVLVSLVALAAVLLASP